MAPQRVHMAVNAMKAIGIPTQTVTPVLKRLLKTYDNNWELIEDENYRVLADAIFDSEDSKRAEDKKNEALINDSSEHPRTRLRQRQDEDRSLPCLISSGTILAESSSKRPKSDYTGSSQICHRQVKAEPISPQTCIIERNTDPISSEAYVTEKRIESVSPQTYLREQNSRPSPTHVAPREKRPVSERASNMSCFKEPKTEPGTELLPKHFPNHCQSNTLILPKSEPFTGEFAQDEVPIAVIHPPVQILAREEAIMDPSSKEGPSFVNDSTGKADSVNGPSSQYVDPRNEDEDGLPKATCKNGTGLELVNVPEASPANIVIASTASGEVKLSLTCSSALCRSDFHVPSLDAVLKLVEYKCLKSYKILEPTFSLIKLMQEFCQCFLELGTDSNGDKQETHVNITPTHDFLKKSILKNVFGTKSDPQQCNCNLPANSSNASPDIHYFSEVAAQVPRSLVLSAPDGLCHRIRPIQRVSRSSNNEWDKKKGMEGSEFSMKNSLRLVVVGQRQSSFDSVKLPHDVNDITRGEERVKISVVNEVGSELYPPSFYYIPQNVVYQNAYVNFSLARIGDEDCCSDCFGDCLSSSIPCACARETGGEYAYKCDGIIKKEFLDECISMNRDPQKHRLFYCNDCPLERTKNEVQPEPCKGHLVRKFIKECWSKCGCNRQCGNRVVQRGIRCNLQVFLTSKGKGWGLRTLEELPRGTFVCEYVGEILTNTELYDRTIQTTGNDRHTYPVLLDADWGSEGVLKDEEALCLDATFYGNVGRFINHRCFDATLVEIPVEVETPDHHYYHLAFFTTRNIQALEELTWDYGIDFDDHNHPVKAFRCCCGSQFCRDLKR